LSHIIKSAESGEPVFTSMESVTLQTIALRWPIFKQKKVRMTISSDLNFCSMGSSQPPSRDTAPLMADLETNHEICAVSIEFLYAT
jgi:hypothetical protein